MYVVVQPNRPDETARIKAAGGTVYFHGVWRVGGILAVSRAIGDRILKPYVTAKPEIRTWNLGASDRCLVLASDGLWDVLSIRDVGETTAVRHIYI
jgi:serine/threonine protein phosphatase PrpC